MKKKLALTAVLMLILVAISTGGVFAYQSIPDGAPVSKSATVWMPGIRKMEGAGRGMGLSETVNTSNGLATSASNNIDVHLQKNTEYGAIVLLGASNYGKQGTGTARYMNSGSTSRRGMSGLATSTGNASGIYELGYYNMDTSSIDWEWTAGGGISFLSAFDKRYRDIYETSGVGKPGDATVEDGVNINRWHGSGSTNFATGSSGFVRGSSTAFSSNNGGASYSIYARAVVVCGSGL